MYIYINTTYVEIMEKVDTVEKTMSEKNISAGELISVIILKMYRVYLCECWSMDTFTFSICSTYALEFCIFN